MKLAIVIVNYNNSKDTLACLKSIAMANYPPSLKEIILVDNNSSSKDVALIKTHFKNLSFIENRVNKGFSEANNQGIKVARQQGADLILLLNNDTIVSKECLIKLITVINKETAIGIVSPKIYFAPGYEFHKQRYRQSEKGKVIWYAGGLLDWENMLASHYGVDEVDRGQYDEITETNFATGCCMLIKKEVFKDIGFLNHQYFLYWEDIDFCQRAKNKGWQILYAGKTYIWHKNASSSGGAGKSTSVYYQTRNRLLFTLKYAPLKIKLVVFKEALKKYFITQNNWEKQGIKDFFNLRFGNARI